MTDFNKELALTLLGSNEAFPVDFDLAMEWWDCKTKDGSPTRKDQLIRKLRQNFDEGVDWSFPQNSGKYQSGTGRPTEKIFMTVACFKEMGMMLGNGRGKEIRRYFLQCEQELKRVKYSEFNALDKPSPQLISDALIAVFRPTDVDPRLISGIIANNIAKTYPALAPAMEEAKKNLVIEIQEKLLTPTEIGAILEQRTGQKYSAQRVNKMLAEAGLQKRNPTGKDPAWLPTPKGSEFSKLLLAAQKGAKDATRQHLQWYEAVVEVLVS